jgi:DNA polymerase III subunit delta
MSASAHLVFGNDEYRVSAKTKEIINSFLPPAEQDLGLETIDGAVDTVDAALSAIGRCVEGIMTRGMFGGKKLVWFRDVSFLADNQAGKSETVKSRLEDLTSAIKAGLPKEHVLVISSPGVDKRFAFFKTSKDIFTVHEFAMPEQGYAAEKQAAERLDETIRRFELKMNSDVRDAFLEKVGIDTRHIAREVEKLSVYLGQKRDVELADIQAVVCATRESKAWDLSDAFGKKDLGSALEVLRRLTFQDVSPFMLIAVIEGRIRDLMIFRQAIDAKWLSVTDSGRSGAAIKWRELPADIEKIFSEAFEKDPRKIHPYRAGLLATQAGKFTQRKLAECQRLAIEAHEKMVSSALEDNMILELMLIRMLS